MMNKNSGKILIIFIIGAILLLIGMVGEVWQWVDYQKRVDSGNTIVMHADGLCNPGARNTNYTLKMTGTINDTSPYLRTNYTRNKEPMNIMNPYIVLNYCIKVL